MLRFKYDADVPPLFRQKDPIERVVGAFLPQLGSSGAEANGKAHRWL
jgi:hypothetical protein